MPEEAAILITNALTGQLEMLGNQVRELSEKLSEKQFWTRPMEPSNSIGHLVLHLTGNLNHFVGAQLGHTGYVRNREREFTETTVPTRDQALDGLGEAIATFRRVVSQLNLDQLASPHPEARLGRVVEGLVHLVAHFAMHRGQMSYLTRLLHTDKP